MQLSKTRAPVLILLFFMAFPSKMGTTISADAALSTASPPSARVLCYGDSLTAGTALPDPVCYPYAPHLESVLKEKGHSVMIRHRGLPGWTTSEMVEDANGGTTGLRTAVRAGMPLNLVIILAGTNDLAFTDDASLISDNILALHRICFEENVPHTLAIGVPSSGYQSVNADAASLAQTVNEKLKEYCQSEPRATFMSFPFAFARDDEKWASDGLHFTAVGYRVLGSSLAPMVEQIFTE